jgi:hypothetical protein
MKLFIKKVFYNSVGKIIRLIQSSLINSNLTPSVQDLVNRNAIQESSEYAIKNLSKAMQFASRFEMLLYCLNKSNQLQNNGERRDKAGGVIAEFGVWQGESINFIAQNCPTARVFGFDSFEGLEEDWYGYKLQKGYFDTNGQLPKVKSNVTLIKGWFENTLPDFVKKLASEQIRILHMDADTYKPSKYVLRSLSNNLRRGSIVIFDEYFGYSGWKLHEFKAWQEVVTEFSINYKYIGYTNMQVAIEIL